MRNDNLDFLLDTLRYLGFGENQLFREQLEDQISKEPREFQLSTDAFYEEDYKVEAILHFKKADRHDMYFFGKYEAMLFNGDDQQMERKQTFYISKGTGVTFKEAFNLLQGRSVNKNLTNIEGEKYNAWIRLNFEEMDPNHNYKVKQYRMQYGYDLEKVLEKYPIKELKYADSRVWLIKALKKGNLQPVSFLKGDREERMFIEACPQFKTINIYSSTRAAQKIVKKPDRALKEGIGIKPGVSETKEQQEEATAVEEGPEELPASINKSPAKKRSRK